MLTKSCTVLQSASSQEMTTLLCISTIFTGTTQRRIWELCELWYLINVLNIFSKSWFVYFSEIENRHSWKELKIIRTSKFDRLKNWVCTWLLSSGQEFDEKFLDSKHVLKVYFKPSRKNRKNLLLPLSSELLWLKILHLYLAFHVRTNVRQMRLLENVKRQIPYFLI